MVSKRSLPRKSLGSHFKALVSYANIANWLLKAGLGPCIARKHAPTRRISTSKTVTPSIAKNLNTAFNIIFATLTPEPELFSSTLDIFTTVTFLRFKYPVSLYLEAYKEQTGIYDYFNKCFHPVTVCIKQYRKQRNEAK